MTRTELQQKLAEVRTLDEESRRQAESYQDTLTKPPKSLGRLEELAVKLAGIYRTPRPSIPAKAAILMAADHGVVAEGVSAFPQEVTLQMVSNFAAGGAAMNVFCRLTGTELYVVDVGVAQDLPELPGVIKRKVAYGTKNFARGPAMLETEALDAMAVGMEIAELAIANGARLMVTGEMGIGNTTPSTAIAAVYSQLPLEQLLGRGAGADEHRLALKLQALKKGLAINQPDPADPLDVLTKVGGLEIAALAGVFLAGARASVPVLVDGLISAAAAIIAIKLEPLTGQYLIAGHRSKEPAHGIMLDILGLKPLLDLELCLGEGTGAALALPLIDASLAVMQEMATFESAGVSGKEG